MKLLILFHVLLLFHLYTFSFAHAKNCSQCFFYDYTADVSTTDDADKVWNEKMILFIEDDYVLFESFSFYKRNEGIQTKKEEGLERQDLANVLPSLPSARFKFAIRRDYEEKQSIYHDVILKDH